MLSIELWEIRVYLILIIIILVSASMTPSLELGPLSTKIITILISMGKLLNLFRPVFWEHWGWTMSWYTANIVSCYLNCWFMQNLILCMNILIYTQILIFIHNNFVILIILLSILCLYLWNYRVIDPLINTIKNHMVSENFHY